MLSCEVPHLVGVYFIEFWLVHSKISNFCGSEGGFLVVKCFYMVDTDPYESVV